MGDVDLLLTVLARAVTAATGLALASTVVFAPQARADGRATPTIDGVALTAAPTRINHECQVVARQVGYDVSCPHLLPAGATEIVQTVGPAAHAMERTWLIHVAPAASLKGWIFSDIQFPSTTRVSHLSIAVAPFVATPFEIVCTCKPSGDYPYARVAYPHNAYYTLRPVGHVTVAGKRAAVVHVIVADGSAMQRHTIVVWTRRGRTYALGFHGLDRAAVALDLAVARSIRYVGGS